jgi:hypothetical protein
MNIFPSVQFGKIVVGNSIHKQERDDQGKLKLFFVNVSQQAADRLQQAVPELIQRLEAQNVDIFLSSGHLDADSERPYYTTTYFVSKPQSNGRVYWETIDTVTSTKSHYVEEMAEGMQLLLDELE